VKGRWVGERGGGGGEKERQETNKKRHKSVQI
jgi:hypothetical protein